MELSTIFKTAGAAFTKNSPTILTTTAVIGVATSAYLTGRAAYKAASVVDADDLYGGTLKDPQEDFIRKAKLTWKLYIPATIAGVATITSIIAAHTISSKRVAAYMSLYAIGEKAFTEYRAKVVEQHGVNKEMKVRDAVAQDRVDANPASSREVIITGSGQVLCYESITGRYFKSSVEVLRAAQNTLNARLISEMYVSLNDLFREIALPITSFGEEVGWTIDKLIELQFSTTISEENEPAIVIGYNYTPIRDYHKF